MASSSSSSSPAAPPAGCIGRVVVLRRSAEGEESEGGALPFESDELVFGRDEHADVRIRLAAVSRIALRLTRDAASGRVLLHNTSSTAAQVALNGVEGAGRVAPAALRHGDVFSIGGRAFRFDYGEQRVRGVGAQVRACDRARARAIARARAFVRCMRTRTRALPARCRHVSVTPIARTALVAGSAPCVLAQRLV